MYTTGKEFKDSWLSAYNNNYKVWYDVSLEGNHAAYTSANSGVIDLTKYNTVGSNYYIDPSTRV